MKKILLALTFLSLVSCHSIPNERMKCQDDSSVSQIVDNNYFSAFEFIHDSVVYVVTTGNGTAIIKHKDLRKQ